MKPRHPTTTRADDAFAPAAPSLDDSASTPAALNAPPVTTDGPALAVMNVTGRVANPKVSVVIPAINEGANLRHVLPQIPSTVFEVILVDGGSTDDTIAVTRTLCPEAMILQQGRRGKGDALIAGFAKCRGDIIVMLDADGSANPEEIEYFVAALLNGADFAKGTRFALGGGTADITWFRRLGNSGLVTLVNLLFGTTYTDLCYGLNAFWARCLPHIDVDCDGFEVETQMNLRIAKARLVVQEVGSFESPRRYGASNLRTIRDGLRVLRVILSERWRWRSSEAGRPEPRLPRCVPREK